jgi:hypothetical protein
MTTHSGGTVASRRIRSGGARFRVKPAAVRPIVDERPKPRIYDRMTKAVLPSLLLLLAACAVKDSHLAHEAETRLMGMSEVDLESCLGVPDQHSSFGDVDILTYYATSTSSDSYSIPIIGGMSFGNGGYCHATFQLKDKHVTQILYSGEKNATGAPDAYCAPIVRTCMAHLQQMSAASTSAPAAPPSSR